MGHEQCVDRLPHRRVERGQADDKLGRKPILILAAGLFICTAVGTGAADTFGLFNVFRLIGGFAIGIPSSLSPMYIAEIAPAHARTFRPSTS